MTVASDELPAAGLSRADIDLIRASVVVVPAYNEALIVGKVVRELAELGYRVVVVDDASTDGTSQAVGDLPITLLRHPINLGQGAALQTGIDWALRLGPESVVTFDSDGQHCSGDIVTLLRALRDEGADVALGSRFLGQAVDLPTSRRLILKGGILFTRLTTGLNLTDVHNGLRAFTARTLGDLRITQNRMAHASEILEYVADRKLRFVEVPCTIKYTDYSVRKGQRPSGAVDIVYDLIVRSLIR
jgi:polyprenyl-phospho-N-acetylgalactosaminyl synthase